LNKLLVSIDSHIVLNTDNVCFVNENDIQYDKLVITKRDIVSAYDYRKHFEDIFMLHPSWIHANLFEIGSNKFLVSVIWSRTIGCPLSSINVSAELTTKLTIID